MKFNFDRINWYYQFGKQANRLVHKSNNKSNYESHTLSRHFNSSIG